MNPLAAASIQNYFLLLKFPFLLDMDLGWCKKRQEDKEGFKFSSNNMKPNQFIVSFDLSYTLGRH